MRQLFEKLYKQSKMSLFKELENRVLNEEKTFLITANPEVFSRSEENEVLLNAMMDPKTIISPDGEGIVKAARMLGYSVEEKIAGVDTVEFLFKVCDQHKKSLYCYGSQQEVLDSLKKVLNEKYPHLVIKGLRNGYTNDKEEVFKEIVEFEPDVVLVALGVPRQELVIYENFEQYSKGVFIGVGGSLDVLSGTKKRAPEILIKLKLEWLYRLLKEPSRIKKFYNTHVKFIFKIKKMAKKVK